MMRLLRVTATMLCLVLVMIVTTSVRNRCVADDADTSLTIATADWRYHDLSLPRPVFGR